MQTAAAGRIGPNAVTRLAEALAKAGDGAAERVFASAGLLRHLAQPPVEMVPDEDVADLHAALRRELGLQRAAAIADRAGRLTADYLLAFRIPALARRLLGLLPSSLALALLLRAIGRHAWTFAGRGRFGWRREGRTFVLSLAGGPVSRDAAAEAPVCAYYAATFERIFEVILRRPVRVVETACEATGAPACEFTVLLA
jgi:divinyl protochlorophyllide a 8-vinyl-reductase